MGQQKEAKIMRERKYKNSDIVSERKKQKIECKKKITQIEKALEAQKKYAKHKKTPNKIEKIANRKNKYRERNWRSGETTVQKRKHILGETMNTGSHKKDEIADENKMDVTKTRKVLIKTNCWQAFANAVKKSTNTELS